MTMNTPHEDGFAMPAEWAPHQACLMEWPTQTRAALWGELLDEAKRDYAAVARAIAAFEPVIMVADPAQAGEAHDHCGSGIEILPVPIDDSWMRDNGPIFVADPRGRLALVHFRFNAWGERYLPYDRDAQVPAAIAAHLGVRRYAAPFVLEGGSIFVDGEGTLLTTEQCLLNPNRNPALSRAEIERGLRDYLGAEAVVWLGLGHSADRDTDGHIDGIAQYVRPGVVMIHAPGGPADPDHDRGRDNVRRAARAADARGRRLEVIEFDCPSPGGISYLNFYLPNGGVVVPVAGSPEDDAALAQIAAVFGDREIVPVPGSTLNEGGGGPHCITQQIPAGTLVSP
jgi:agmatine deiminase